VHLLASQKKTQQWQTLLSKLEGDFSSDRNHFFSEIVKIRRKHSPQQCSLQSVRLTNNNVTNEPEKVKRALFDLHSGMGKEDADNDKFDKLHFHKISSVVSAICGTEIGADFCERLMSKDEIGAALSEAKNHKACGIDQIANEPQKYGGEPVALALHKLFSIMLRTCICPSIWAKALVHLIYKEKGSDPLDPRCYRPISLTSCISKVFKHVILNRLNEEIDNKGTLEEEQAGFCTGRSTRDQTYILRELLDSRKAAGQTTFLCFVDLTNAFPSTWQDGMWFRLQELGVKGRLY
jgi:hypothetical protein